MDAKKCSTSAIFDHKTVLHIYQGTYIKASIFHSSFNFEHNTSVMCMVKNHNAAQSPLHCTHQELRWGGVDCSVSTGCFMMNNF